MTAAADCEREAIQAYLAGADDDCARHWEAAHRAAVAAGDPAEAARYAFWLGFGLLFRGRTAQAGGWLARGERMIAAAGTDCPASGYLLIPHALEALGASEPQHAADLSARATRLGEQFGDADLRAFGMVCHGQALIALGDGDAGVAQLDEVMVSVTTGELGPIATGLVYCAVILTCTELFDLRRASEWTDALAAWCDARPGLVPYRGQCLVHRSQLQQARGEWTEAVISARAACRHLTDPPHPALGFACYQEGELHRLRGKLDDAQRCYRLASRHGYDPMPGLALLQLARGDGVAAAKMIGRAVREPGLSQPAWLAAAVEIYLSTGDFEAAQVSADELSRCAAGLRSPVVRAMAAQAAGATSIAKGGTGAALVALRDAKHSWQSLSMPYDAARAAALLGSACAAVGDRTGAQMEFDWARDVFTQLDALPDLERLNTLAAGPARSGCPLTPREQEVLARLAAGDSNRQIAAHLVVSTHTVARHVEHIYAKLGVTNRAAATSYAYEHNLV